jgi:serine/threonine protein kinase
MLQSHGTNKCGMTAKVADFGLSVKLDLNETHVSNLFRGTKTHMAPEVLLHGLNSKASDV